MGKSCRLAVKNLIVLMKSSTTNKKSRMCLLPRIATFQTGVKTHLKCQTHFLSLTNKIHPVTHSRMLSVVSPRHRILNKVQVRRQTF